MTSQRSRVFMIAVALMGLSGAAVTQAQTDFSKFPLTKGIPDDVFIAVAARGNPERAFLDAYWSEVHKAFMDSGVLTDVWDLVMENVDDEKLEMVENLHARFSELCAAVDWEDLFGKEMIWAGRFYTPFPQAFQFEGVLMGRLTNEKAEANYKALKALMEELVKFIESQGGQGVLAVTEDTSNGQATATMDVLAVPGMKVASITYWKDTIVIGLGGTQIAKDAVGLLQGKSQKKALVNSARFKSAFQKLPPAEDTLVFFDSSGMLASMNGMVKMIEGAVGNNGGKPGKRASQGRSVEGDDSEAVSMAQPKRKPPARAADSDEDDADAESDSDEADDEAADEADTDDESGEMDGPGPWLRVASRLLDDFSTFDYMAEVEWTDGMRVYTEHLTQIRAGTEKNAFTKCITSGEPLKDFARFVPKESTTFSCSSGLNMTALYDYVIDFVRQEVPGGTDAIKTWEGIQETTLKLNVRDDVCAVFTGPFVSVQMGQDWVMLIGVSDEELATAQIDRLINFVKEKVGQEQGLSLTPTTIGKAKFTQISHPMMMMMGGLAPVIGCAEKHLIVGSSSKAVSTCLKTAAGQHPNITKSKQFVDEALMPTGGELGSISFTDERNFAQELQGAIAGLSMGLGFAAMGMQDLPPQGQAIFRALPPLLAKLAPVAGKLDFYQSSAEYTTFDGKAWHSRMVQNYKKPQPKSEEDDESSADDAADADSDEGDSDD